jgi:hypothetical protein
MRARQLVRAVAEASERGDSRRFTRDIVAQLLERLP